MTQQLSIAAQAVAKAALHVSSCDPEDYPNQAEEIAAAALRVAADQSHPKAHIEDIDYVHQSYVDGWKDALDVILAVADELEAQ
jgi:hypothetical protein